MQSSQTSILKWLLNNYYQKVNPVQIRSTDLDQREYIPFESNLVSNNHRKALYAASFKKASMDRNIALINYNQYKMETGYKLQHNLFNNSKVLYDPAKSKQTPSNIENQQNKIGIKRKQSKSNIDNKLWVYGSNKINKAC